MNLNNFKSIFVGAWMLASAITAQATTDMPKHMVFASDTQYPWTDKTDRRIPESDSEFKERSKWLVETQLCEHCRIQKSTRLSSAGSLDDQW